MSEDQFSAYYLERYVLGEIPEEIAEKIRKKAEGDTKLLAELEAIKASNREVLARYPQDRFREELDAFADQERKASKSPSLKRTERIITKSFSRYSRKPILALSTAAAALLVFLFVVLPTLNDHSPLTKSLETIQADPVDKILVKGEDVVDLTKTQILVYRKKGDSVELMENSQKAWAGDLLQLAYVSANEGYGVVFSIDGRGLVSLHFPAEREGSTQLEQHRKIVLPTAIELDDAPDFERFFLITAGAPLNVPQILEMAGNLADSERPLLTPLNLPDRMSQFSFLILKGEVR